MDFKKQLDTQWTKYGQICYKIENIKSTITKLLPADSRDLLYNLDYWIGEKARSILLIQAIEHKMAEEEQSSQNTEDKLKE